MYRGLHRGVQKFSGIRKEESSGALSGRCFGHVRVFQQPGLGQFRAVRPRQHHHVRDVSQEEGGEGAHQLGSDGKRTDHHREDLMEVHDNFYIGWKCMA